MKNVIIAAKFLKRQLILNLIIVVEVLLSVMMLTELFVYVSDRMDNQRAAKELNNDNLFVLTEFEYYYESEDYLISILRADSTIEKIGKADVLECKLNNQYLYLGLYNSDLIDIYCPKISEGTWFSSVANEYEACPAVVSSDTGLHVGSIVEILVANDRVFEIQVIGILASPTQYLLPTGMSDSIDSLISQQPVILLDSTQIPNMTLLSKTGINGTKSLFLLTEMTKDQLVSGYNKYGSIQSINDMIQRFTKNSNELILSETVLFILFFFLASIVILSAEVIHSINCQRSYTIYYLLGMKWEKCVWIECIRHIVLLAVIIGVTILLDRYGGIQTTWLANDRLVMFYVVLIIYLTIALFGTSALFIRNLLRRDISVSLKSLNGGE